MAALRSYGTLAGLRDRQALAASDTSDDARLLRKLRSATADIEAYTNRIFQPLTAAYTFDHEDDTCLNFRNHELLTLTSIVDGFGRTILSAAVILLGNAQSSSTANGPFYGFELDPTVDYLLYQTTPIRAITVTGVWGYHDDYANAFHGSGVTVQDNPLSNSNTMVTTSTNNSTTLDDWGQSVSAAANAGTVSTGHLIKVDSELMHVVSYTDSTHIKVIRAANGTTAASHVQGTTIQVYEPPRDIIDATLRYAGFLAAQDDADYSKTIIDAMGRAVVPAGLPPDILDVLDRHKKVLL